MEFTVYMVYTLSSSPPCLLVYKGRRREACLIGSYRLTPFVISKCRCFVIGQSLFENLTQTPGYTIVDLFNYNENQWSVDWIQMLVTLPHPFWLPCPPTFVDVFKNSWKTWKCDQLCKESRQWPSISIIFETRLAIYSLRKNDNYPVFFFC